MVFEVDLFRILERHFLLGYLRHFFWLVSLLSILVAWSLVDSSPLSGVYLLKFMFSCLPLAVVMTVPLAVALAWVVNRHGFIAQGEWQSFRFYGLRYKRCLLLIWLIGLIITLFAIAFANAKFIRDYQSLMLENTNNVVSKNVLFYKKNLIKVDGKTVNVISKNNAAIQYDVFNHGSGRPDISFKVKNSQATGLSNNWQLIKIENIAIICLLTLMLFWATFLPIQNTRWPLFYAVLSCVLLFVLNVNVIKWLGKHAVFEAIGPSVQLFLFLLIGNLDEI